MSSRPYAHLSDAELDAEIVEYQSAKKAILLGNDGVGVVKKVSDGGRMVEYTGANLAALDRELTALLAERNRRLNPRRRGRAIRVDFT